MDDILKSVSLFEGLAEHEIALFNHFGVVRQYAKGDILVKEGEACTMMFVILHGSVRIDSKTGEGRTSFSLLQPGDFIGEISFLIGTTPGASVVAYEDTRALTFHHDALKEFLFTNPGIGMHFLWALSESLCLKIRKTTTSLTAARSIIERFEQDQIEIT